MRMPKPCAPSVAAAAVTRESVGVTPFEEGLETESDESQAGQKRRESEGGDELYSL